MLRTRSRIAAGLSHGGAVTRLPALSRRQQTVSCVAAALVLLLAGCFLCARTEFFSQPGLGPASEMSRDDDPSTWPFTVDEGAVACDSGAVTFTAGGVTYAINHPAREWGLGADPAPILDGQASGDAAEGALAPIVERGLALCRYQATERAR
jgi:hypothetical protein